MNIEMKKNYYNKEITGKQFNEINGQKPLYKLTNKEENHYGFQYKDGLNEDRLEFNTKEYCLGGLYFANIDNIYKFISINKYIRKVTIPDDARVCIFEDKIKANKIIVGPRCKLSRRIFNVIFRK
jgi:hypothetical protein